MGSDRPDARPDAVRSVFNASLRNGGGGNFMGAWGTGPFDNDAAADWLAELADAEDLGPVRAELVRTANWPPSAPLEEEDASVAIAAAQVVAEVAQPSAGPPPEMQSWVGNAAPVVTRDDLRLAAHAVARVLGPNSDLAQLWGGSEEGTEWHVEVQALRNRLAEYATR